MSEQGFWRVTPRHSVPATMAYTGHHDPVVTEWITPDCELARKADALLRLGWRFEGKITKGSFSLGLRHVDSPHPSISVGMSLMDGTSDHCMPDLINKGYEQFAQLSAV